MNGQDVVPLTYKTERNVMTSGGVSVGQRVRCTEEWLAYLRAGGVSEKRVAMYRAGGVVTQIVDHPSWTMARIRLDGADPEAVKRDPENGYTWDMPSSLVVVGL